MQESAGVTKPWFVLVVLSGAIALRSLTANATSDVHEYNLGPIHISQPWAKATPKGASSGAAYLTITNKGPMSDRVSCLSSDVSVKCAIHAMTMDDGVMQMRPVENGLEVKPGETVVLKPSGLHLMLTDLKHPIEQGKTIEATLKFEKAGTIEVEFPVAAAGDTNSNDMMEMHKH
jgi:periplasmic copper chaperone A